MLYEFEFCKNVSQQTTSYKQRILMFLHISLKLTFHTNNIPLPQGSTPHILGTSALYNSTSISKVHCQNVKSTCLTKDLVFSIKQIHNGKLL
jgi:hypothetical protein